jgi:hypothetical protein
MERSEHLPVIGIPGQNGRRAVALGSAARNEAGGENGENQAVEHPFHGISG